MLASSNSAETDPRQGEYLINLEGTRKALLNKSDWLGLATSRPLKFSPRTRDDIEGIGRRRKKAQVKQGMVMRRKESKLRVSRSVPPAPEISSLHADEISLRIGSNIHQTQTTPSVFLRKEPAHTAERAILDLSPPRKSCEEEKTRNTWKETWRKENSNSVQVHTCRPRRRNTPDLESANEPNLVALNEAVALGLTSWDRVRRHARSGTKTSVSIAHSLSHEGSPAPLDFDMDVHWKHESCQLDEELSIPDCFDGDFSLQRTIQPFPDLIRRGIAVGLLKDGMSQSSCPESFPQRALHSSQSHPLADERTEVPYENDIALDAKVVLSQEFTLDDQVKLEQTVEGLEREDRHKGGSSSAADNVGQSDAIDSLWCFDGISTSATSVMFDSGRALVFSSNEAESDASYHPVAMDTDKEHPSRTDEVTDNISSETGYPVTGQGVEERAPLSTEHRPPMTFTRQRGQREDQTGASEMKVMPNTERSTGMNDKAWMRYVCPEEFGQVQDGFHFQAGTVTPTSIPCLLNATPGIDKTWCSDYSKPSLWVGPHQPGPECGIFNSPTSIPSAVNTSIFIASTPGCEHLETDFLSQLSPMEGCFDERLVDTSLYNNAPRTDPTIDTSPIRSLHKFRNTGITEIPRSLLPAKRKASDPPTERPSSDWLRLTDWSGPEALASMYGLTNGWLSGDFVSTSTVQNDSVTTTMGSPATVFQHRANKSGNTHASVLESLDKNGQEWRRVAHREEVPASIFSRSDKLTADMSPSLSCRSARSTIGDYVQATAFPLWSDVSTTASTRFASLEPTNTLLSASMSSVTQLRPGEEEKQIVDTHATRSRYLVRGATGIATQIPLWGEGQGYI
ncbi:hypothetical protein Z517_09786 [Fonsecaea pedrosoi CBS 271.37]|uniref:Uncharacterized protein n=1 Tax=Fonsecaea pedrosoi CBS 271.37 TaxID=1442368 RepID=A0A0D2GFC0_9EURO|nr:uncharacterized protein Z517_09786 [Fonsecaea pedrosoi CBS 271.37]KIW77340.1 hypothetical protein Z517_09786 [Fonsecaea pedrosoi CBS 271.37]